MSEQTRDRVRLRDATAAGAACFNAGAVLSDWHSGRFASVWEAALLWLIATTLSVILNYTIAWAKDVATARLRTIAQDTNG